jgi:uncharacterized protein
MSTAAADLVAVVRLLVDDPRSVAARERPAGDGAELELRVAEADRGQVIGRHGRTIDALRALVRARGAKEDRPLALDLLDD